MYSGYETFVKEVTNRNEEEFILENFDVLGKHIIDKYMPTENDIMTQYFEYLKVSDKDKQAAQRLFDALDENDAVNNIYSNIKN